MILLKLNPYEVMTLSSFSKIPMQKNSPLAGQYMMEMINFNREEYQSAMASFVDNGFLVSEDEDYTLAKEMEALMLLLHRPEVTVSIKRLREVAINEVDLCFNKGFALHYLRSALDDIHTLTYPHFTESIGSWLRKEAFANLDFDDEPLAPYEVFLSVEEILSIFIYFSFIKFRFQRGEETLAMEKTYVAIGAIRNFNKFEELEGMLIGRGDPEVLKDFISNSDNMDKAIENLIRQGIFIEKDGAVTLADYYKSILDPGKISDTYLIGEHLPELTTFHTVYIVKGGYVVMKTVDPNVDIASMKLEVYPSSMDLADFMKILCPSAFPNGFGDEEKYRQAMKKQMEAALEAAAEAKSKARSEVMSESKAESEAKSEALAGGQVQDHRQTSDYNNLGQDSGVSQGLKTHKFCSQCGTKLPIESKFCHTCGKPQ